MIFNFRIVSDEVENFKREIKIDADDTFFELKNAICESAGYDKNQMCSFFLCDQNWEKEKEITMEDMGADSDEDVWIMDECILSDYIEDEGQRLIFTFDYLTERSFFIEMKEMITGKKLNDPVCSLAIGQAPPQLMDFEEFESKNNAKAAAAASDDLDLGEDFYGDSDYNEDEFDASGFDDVNNYE